MLQEIRLLLGGEAWDPVLVASAAGIPAKLYNCRLVDPSPLLQATSSSFSASHTRWGEEEEHQGNSANSG